MTSLEETNTIGGDKLREGQEKKDSVSVVLLEPERSSASGGSDLDHYEAPDAIDSITARCYGSLDELHDTLEELGCSDWKFKLDENGFAVMPGYFQNNATEYFRDRLDAWSKGWVGRWGKARSKNVMQVPGFTPTGRQRQREPDVAFWGYPLCEKIEDLYMPKDRPDGADFSIDPDVAFQFSYGTSFPTEEANMDLIMAAGIGKGNQGPRVGFLIKIQFASGNAVGMDIYKVPHNCTVADALNQTNGATHMTYTHGQAADLSIEISPEEMGIEGMWAHICPSFKLSMKKLFAVGKLSSMKLPTETQKIHSSQTFILGSSDSSE
jgi:hypothetical protein